MKLLLIDDNPFDADLIKNELRDIKNAEFDHIQSYREFINYYRPGKYNAILSDFNVPGLSTINLLKEVRAGDKLVPYIFISGTVGEEQAVELLKLGATDYVLKSNLAKLPLALSRALKERNTAIAEEKAINALRENEKRFRNILEFAPDATLLVDENGVIQFANRQAEKVFGYPANELYLHPLEKLIPERYRQRHVGHRAGYTQKPAMRIMGAGMELYGLRKDGTEFPADISLSPVSGSDNSYTVCSVRDITQRKAAEKEILKKKEMLKDAQHLAKVGTWELTTETDEIKCSTELYNILGIAPGDQNITFELIFDCVHPDDREKIQRVVKKNVSEMLAPAPLRYRIITPAGHLKYIESKARNLKDENGTVISVIGTVQDITDIITAEEEKIRIQERAMAMLEEKVNERTKELHETNHILEIRNHEITDSISYARNIQRAILSKDEDCKKIFPESFVLWMPKAVVSGDFYWCHSNAEYVFLAVADCTGHGVPGALMSIIANQLLDRIVGTYRYFDPRDILFHLDDAIISSLKQETGPIKDGMDIAIVRVNKKNKTLTFAGAQRPLFYYNGQMLEEIPGNKTGVGGFLSGSEHKVFTQVQFVYKTGDSFFLTSDGYYSQFKGGNGKKMMKKRMKECMLQITSLAPDQQKKRMYEYFRQWQQQEEQVDDVLVIGVRL